MNFSSALLPAMFAFATISCASAPPPVETPRLAQRPAAVEENPPAAPRVDAREAATRALVAEVARHRGLAETTPLDIRFEDKETFARSVERAAAEDDEDPEVERAKWVAFGFAGPDVDPAALEKKVLEEQVAAFYDSKEKRLHVPLAAPGGADGEREAEIILSHEIEHGLQDEHFPIPDLTQAPDDDAALAEKAIYEGDATFVMIAMPASRVRPLDAAAMLQIARQLGSLPAAQLEAMSGKESPELEKAPRIVRAELLFPYFAGMQLVAELYQRGGYPLVDRLFQHPPASTAQVLHPEKYLAGERPAAIDPPELPAGARELARGRLGELGVRTLLEGCLEARAAQAAAQGLRGDAYAISARAGGALALEWSTAWSSGADAARFEQALAQAERAGCFPAVAPEGKSTWSLEAGGAHRRAGQAVAFVRGVPAAGRGAMLARLLGLPHPPTP